MMKMKRSKNDAIKCTVGSYLKRRHYTDTENFLISELQLSETHQQMAVLASIDKETANPNTFIYSSMSYDMWQVDNQFASLQTWISELNCSLSHELTPLLCPIFCHLYLDMFLCCSRPSTLRFLKRYQSLLMNNDQDRELLEGLSNAQLNDDPEVSPVVGTFRSSKYRAKLSENALIMLQKYLVVNGHMALLQVLNMYFDLEVDDNRKKEEDDRNSQLFEMRQCSQEEGEEEDDKELIHVRKAIRVVREDAAPPPKLQLFTVVNNVCNVYCGVRISGDTTAVGWDNEVRLFGPNTSQPISTTNPLSHLRLPLPGSSSTPPLATPSAKLPVSWTTYRSHSGPVQDISMVQDVMVSVSRDKTMRAWNRETGSCVAIYRGHNYPIWSVSVGPLGTIATGSRDKTARLWTLDRLYPLRIFAGHMQDVECVRFHPNGQYLATGSTDRTVRLWSVTDARMVRVLACGGAWGSVQALAFSPDGKFLASAGEDKRVRVWDLAASAVLAELKGHNATIQDLAWSIDSQQLASASLDGSVRLWDVRNVSTAGAQLSVYQTGYMSILSVYFSQGQTLSCVATDKYVHKTHV